MCAASRCIHRRARTKAAARYLCIFFVLLLVFGCAAEEEEDNNDGSEDNEAHDYEDDDGGDWWGDDPYLEMIDDAVRHQLNAQIQRDRNAAKYKREHTTHEIVKYVTSISLSIVGVASAIFCTAVSLYFIRVDALMRQYSEDGVEVDGRIVASVPDIREAKKSNQINNPDSYSMMSDDGSYRLDSDSISERSGQGTGKTDIEGAQSIEVAGADEVEIVNEEGRQPHVIVAMHSAKMEGSKLRQRAYKENALISGDVEAFHPSKSFRVLVEYNGNPYHQGGIDRTASETIRKRLLVRGEDIVETPGNGLLVKLHLLQDRPKSGYPSGEIERTLRVEKRLSSNLHLMFGVALVLVGVGAAGALLPPKLFYAYVGVLICQVPLVACFLNRAFSKIVSDRYLDNGSSGHSLGSKSGPEEKDKMVAALRNGTSFGSFA